jgi:hypothetical protein
MHGGKAMQRSGHSAHGWLTYRGWAHFRNLHLTSLIFSMFQMWKIPFLNIRKTIIWNLESLFLSSLINVLYVYVCYSLSRIENIYAKYYFYNMYLLEYAIQRGFIVIFPCVHIRYFDQIHPLYCSFLFPFPHFKQIYFGFHDHIFIHAHKVFW